MWFNRAYGLIFLPIAMALGIGGFLTLYFSRNLDENRYRLVHAYEVMDKTRAVIAELQELESAQRDYVFTGQQAALSSYQGRSALLRRSSPRSARSPPTIRNNSSGSARWIACRGPPGGPGARHRCRPKPGLHQCRTLQSMPPRSMPPMTSGQPCARSSRTRAGC